MQDISGLILTFNEERNILRCLSRLGWLSEVLVIDSGSTDNTLSIVKSFNNTRVEYRKFDNFANQCNYGLSLLSSEWVLSLDADYIVPTKTTQELLSRLRLDNSRFDAYSFRFYYCINGKPIRSALLPQRTSLYRRNVASYVQIGHGHRVEIAGKSCMLKNRLLHDDRKDFDIWLENQRIYQKKEAYMLKTTKSSLLPLQDKIRKHTILAPALVFMVTFIIKGGLFEGPEGLIYAYQRLISECILYVYVNSTEQS